MSGGIFDYQDMTTKYRIFGYTDKPSNVFEDMEISELVWDVFNLIHAFDWYKSGDTGERNYLEMKAFFKHKWFNCSSEDRTKRIIDQAIQETRQKLYKTFGINSRNALE